MKLFFRICMIAVLLLAIDGCSKNRFFEQNKSIDKREWHYDQELHFVVDITDTTSFYDLELNVRHNTNYPYTNLWIEFAMSTPSGSADTVQHQIKLGDNQQEEWIGECLGDVCDALIPLYKKMKFEDQGRYQFMIRHIMRTNPLPGIMNVGLRLKKAKIYS